MKSVCFRYFREVLLVLRGSRKVVEFGAIKINLALLAPSASGESLLDNSSSPQQAKNCPGFVGSMWMHVTAKAVLVIASGQWPVMGPRWQRSPQRAAMIRGKPNPIDRTAAGAVRNAEELLWRWR